MPMFLQVPFSQLDADNDYNKHDNNVNNDDDNVSHTEITFKERHHCLPVWERQQRDSQQSMTQNSTVSFMESPMKGSMRLATEYPANTTADYGGYMSNTQSRHSTKRRRLVGGNEIFRGNEGEFTATVEQNNRAVTVNKVHGNFYSPSKGRGESNSQDDAFSSLIQDIAQIDNNNNNDNSRNDEITINNNTILSRNETTTSSVNTHYRSDTPLIHDGDESVARILLAVANDKVNDSHFNNNGGSKYDSTAINDDDDDHESQYSNNNQGQGSKRFFDKQLGNGNREILHNTESEEGKNQRALLNKSKNRLADSFTSPMFREFDIINQRKRRQTPVVITNSKSIVGSRPKHWGATPSSHTTHVRSLSRVFSDRGNKKAKLAAALDGGPLPGRNMNRNMHSSRTNDINHNGSNFTQSNQQAWSTQKSVTPKSFTSRPQPTPMTIGNNSIVNTPVPTTNVPSLSKPFFTPNCNDLSIPNVIDASDNIYNTQTSVIGSPSRTSNVATNMNTGNSNSITTNSISDVWRNYSPSRVKKGMSVKAGTWTRRLQSITSRVSSDLLRLSSGQYPFTINTACMDFNDPRRRAISCTTVTVLGRQQPTRRFEDDNSQMYLAYIHNHIINDKTHPAITVPSNSLGWLLVPTAGKDVEHGLELRSEWRLYNCAAISINEPCEEDDNSNQLHFLFICSELRERYPSVLPVLPDIDTIKESL